MKSALFIILTLISLAWHPTSQAGLIVVVHKSNPVDALSSREVLDIYMGRFNSYPDGNSVDTTDHPQDSQIREDFYDRLVGKSIPQVNAYWARLLFTGKAEPPLTQSSALDVVQYVQGNTNAIAYLYDTTLSDNLKVVFRFEDPR